MRKPAPSSIRSERRQQVGPQDQVPERGSSATSSRSAVDRDRQHLARLDDDRRDERRLAGEQAELAEEAARAVHARSVRSSPPSPSTIGDLALEDRRRSRTARRPRGRGPRPRCVRRRSPCAASTAICSSLSRGKAPCRSGVSVTGMSRRTARRAWRRSCRATQPGTRRERVGPMPPRHHRRPRASAQTGGLVSRYV